MYHNNDFIGYFKREYADQKRMIAAGRSVNLWQSILAFLAAVFRVIGLILKDAAIELVMVIIFSKIVFKMAQGRDLIVSMFEPGALYGDKRIILTICALLAFSISMWIIPAVLFEWRKKFSARLGIDKDPFKEHLFFAHRVLPLIPFWTMAYGLFNDHGWLFTGLAVAEVCLFSLVHVLTKTRKVRVFIFYGVLIALVIVAIYFVRNFQVEYLYAKRALAIILYLLSVLVFMIYFYVDNKILNEHYLGKPQSASKKYPFNTGFYLFCLLTHIVLVVLFISNVFALEIAPESMLLYVFALYVFIIDFIYYVVNLRPLFRIIAAVVIVVTILLFVCDVREFNTNHYTVDRTEVPAELSVYKSLSLDAYYDQWKARITSDSTDPYPIILVAGEGGGSRAGFWFSQNLIDFDYATNGKFREHIFSLSTVSGSTVGLSTYFAYLDQPLEQNNGQSFVPDKYRSIPEKVYQTNFVGSSIIGLFLADLYHSLVPGNPTQDRNNVLMQQESRATRSAIAQVTGKTIEDIKETPLDQEYLSVFYDKDSGYRKFRMDHPLALINTTRSDDGRRGIYAPIKLDSKIFNDALDVVNYIYNDTLWPKIAKSQHKPANERGIKFGVACVSSELFPILSAPLYVDSLGSFVDGGYHENSGLKTTLDVYGRLSQLLAADPDMKGRKYHIYILYLKNGGSGEDLYRPKPLALPILQPLNALLGQPFNGSASYFEQRAKFISNASVKSTFLQISLDSRMLRETSAQEASDGKSGIKTTDSLSEEELAKMKRVQNEILNDLHMKTENGKKDSLLNFPLARWLSNSVIEQMKKNQQRIMADSTKGVMPLLKQVIRIHNKD